MQSTAEGNAMKMDVAAALKPMSAVQSDEAAHDI